MKPKLNYVDTISIVHPDFDFYYKEDNSKGWELIYLGAYQIWHNKYDWKDAYVEEAREFFGDYLIQVIRICDHPKILYDDPDIYEWWKD